MASRWDNLDNAERYGTGTPGTSADWKAAFDERMGREEAVEVLGGDDCSQARKILGVDAKATWNAIKAAFYKLAKKFHPDMKGGDAAKFREARAAYSLLKDEEDGTA